MVKNGILRAADEPADAGRAARPGRGGAEHDQRALRCENHFSGAVERCAVGDGNFDRVPRDDRDGFGLFGRDVFRQFQQNRAGSFLLGNPERIPHEGRDGGRTDDLP